MDQQILIGLVNNIALLLSLAILYDTNAFRRLSKKYLFYQILTGILLSVICIVVMLNPWKFSEGIVFDSRSVLISISGLFFGYITTVLAVLISAFFRSYIGGAGMWTGISVIVVSAIIGLLWRHFSRKDLSGLSMGNLYLFGIIVHAAMLLMMFSLPYTTAISVLSNISLPVMIIFPLGTVFLGRLLIMQLLRKKVEAALRRSEKLLIKTQQISKVGGWEYDLNTGTTFWTDEVYRIYGVSKENYDPNSINQDISFYFSEDQSVVEDAFNKAVTKGEPYDLVLRLTTAQGNLIWVRTMASVERKEGKIIRVHGNIIDITESVLAQKALSESEERFRQAQKMEAIGRLAGGVAHDFNNLLSVIIGYSEILRDDIDPSHPHYNHVEEIFNASVSAKELTKQLLAYSSKQMLETKIFNINDTILGFERLLRRVLGEDIELEIKLMETPGFIKADIHQLEQVIINLAVNAKDAMPDGGKLTIETASVNIDENFTPGKTEILPGPYILTSISDNGTGIDPEILNNIFEPFFTTKSYGRGTGLGLATVYGIIRQHGGNIRVYSEPEQGTTFKIYLPEAGAEKFTEQDNNSNPVITIAGQATVLVVEDEIPVRKMTCKILSENGYDVIESENADNALDTAFEFEGEIHLLLTDVIMPDMKGPELYQRILEFKPGTRVLYMSGYTGDVITKHGILQEEIEFIQKPFTRKELLNKVARVISMMEQEE